MFNDYFLPCGNDGADMTAAIEEKLFRYGTCFLGSGTYTVTGVRMPEGSSLIGVGANTKILLREDVTDSYAVRLNTMCTVKNLSVIGSEDDVSLPECVGARHGLGFVGTATIKDYKNQPRHAIINDCYIHGFSGGGITCTDTGYSVASSMTVSDCHIWNCGAGVNISHFSEYHTFTNVLCMHCLYGCINNGGNNVFVNCGFNGNKIGFMIDNSEHQSPNNSHGSAVGCTFNHTDGNGGVGIKILGAKSGYSFTGCQLFFSHIVLEDSDDIIFSGLNTGRQVEIHVTGGKLTLFTDSSFGCPPDAICITDNELVKFTNCWTRDGLPVMP